MTKTRKKRARVPGLVITITLLLIVIEFIALLAVTKLLPVYLLVAGGLVLLTCLLFVCFLTGDFRKKAPFTIGSILGIFLLVVIILGNLYIFQTYNTLNKISGVNTKTSQIGVYVLADDPAQTIIEAKDYTFGTLSELDVDNTTEAVRQINEEIGSEITVKEVSGVMELVDSLVDGDCGAIILNHAYLPVLEEIEGYEDIDSTIREIDLRDVDTVIEENLSGSLDNQQDIKTVDSDDVLLLYISGIDTRGTQIINTRSDVNIIAAINTETKQVLLVSTPRDYYVPLSISGGVPDKLTHAGIYGVDVSMDTLGMLYGIDIDNYFRVNFAGFVNIIDALGGITIESDYDFSSGNVKGYHFNKGSNYVNGEEALAFARERYAFTEGDRQRGRNQMAVIEGVINKVMSPELLSNYSSVLSAVEGSFETNVSYNKIAELVRDQLANGGSWNIVSYSVDGSGDTKRPYSMSAYAYVMVPDQTTVDKAKELIQQVVDGEVINLNK